MLSDILLLIIYKYYTLLITFEYIWETLYIRLSLLEIGVEVMNSGKGYGNGLYVEVEVDTIRVTTSLKKRESVFHVLCVNWRKRYV